MQGIVVYVREGIEPNLPLLVSYFGAKQVVTDFKPGGNVYDNTLYITNEKTPDAVDYDAWYYKLLNPDDVWPGACKRFLIEIKNGKMWLTVIKPDEKISLIDNVEASYAAVPLRVAHMYMAAILAGFEPPRYFVPLETPAH